MNQRNYARQLQIAKSVIPNCSRCFGRKSPTPIIAIKPVPNFDFVHLIDLLMKETAIADQAIIVAMNNCKLRWQPTTLPVNEFVQKSNGLFRCKSTERKPHEIRIRHQRREKIDIFLAERPKNEAACFKFHVGTARCRCPRTPQRGVPTLPPLNTAATTT